MKQLHNTMNMNIEFYNLLFLRLANMSHSTLDIEVIRRRFSKLFVEGQAHCVTKTSHLLIV